MGLHTIDALWRSFLCFHPTSSTQLTLLRAVTSTHTICLGCEVLSTEPVIADQLRCICDKYVLYFSLACVIQSSNYRNSAHASIFNTHKEFCKFQINDRPKMMSINKWKKEQSHLESWSYASLQIQTLLQHSVIHISCILRKYFMFVFIYEELKTDIPNRQTSD